MRACEPAHAWIVVAVQGFVGEEQLRFSAGARRRSSCSPEPGGPEYRSTTGSPSVPASPSGGRGGAEGTRSWSRSRSKGRSLTRGDAAGSEETQQTDTPDVTLVLISRRQWRRAGTRYHHRGIDDHGMFGLVAYAQHATLFANACMPANWCLTEGLARGRQCRESCRDRTDPARAKRSALKLRADSRQRSGPFYAAPRSWQDKADSDSDGPPRSNPHGLLSPRC